MSDDVDEAGEALAEAEVKQRHISSIWLVPIIAAVLGIGMLVHTYMNRGPEVLISFDDAAGIEAGKTPLKVRNVEIGRVTRVRLNRANDGVFVIARIEPEATELLRADSDFWVVRPRVVSTGISGLGTLLSGAYIELAPGTGAVGARDFVGLEEAPLTGQGIPGVRIELLSDDASSLYAGAPVMFRGYRVGLVESEELDTELGHVRAQAFVRAPYDSLITTATRFWNASGIAWKLSADGVMVDTGSLESVLVGGVAFATPATAPPGEAVADNARFQLYPNRDAIEERPYLNGVDYLLLFDASVRGLVAGAPVEYRGVRVGSVSSVSFNRFPELAVTAGEARRVPVIIRLEPGGWLGRDSEAAVKEMQDQLVESVANGLRATLRTGSLITGSLYVSFEYYPAEEVAPIGQLGGLEVLPTRASGLEALEAKVGGILDKLNALQLDALVNRSTATLKDVGATARTARETLANLNQLVGSDAAQKLPATLDTTVASLGGLLDDFRSGGDGHSSLVGTLDQLRETLAGLSPETALYRDIEQAAAQLTGALQGLEALSNRLQNRPSDVIFARPRPADAVPGGRQ